MCSSSDRASPASASSHAAGTIPTTELPRVPLSDFRREKSAYVAQFGGFTKECWLSQANKVVAVKSLGTELANIHKELELMWACREHKNLVRLLALAEGPGGELALVMEWAEGGSLADVLYGSKSPLNEASVAMQVAAALQYLHTQSPPIIHCNVRAATVLLDARRERAMLGEFGNAFVAAYAWTAPEALRSVPCCLMCVCIHVSGVAHSCLACACGWDVNVLKRETALHTSVRLLQSGNADV